ncbi:glycosyltransferase family 2 protein [Kluyvera sichuanensis]
MSYVSIVMPAFNSDKFIEKAVNSVLSQTYTDFELLICDDGSTDKTVDIIEEYSQKDSRVILLKNENAKGAAGARNTCLDYAQGEYIAFLDSDDYWSENKLFDQLIFMKSNMIVFCYANYVMLSGNSVKNIYSRRVNTFDSLTFTCDIGCLTVMLHKSAIGDSRFPYIPKEDYAFWLILLKKGLSAYNLNETVAYYRKQKNSLSSNKFKEIIRQYKVLNTVTELPRKAIFLRVVTYIYNALLKHFIK